MIRTPDEIVNKIMIIGRLDPMDYGYVRLIASERRIAEKPSRSFTRLMGFSMRCHDVAAVK
ncbi:MAG: hypothetical protein ACREQO_13250, partial [Candidatus Binatia bacterium]